MPVLKHAKKKLRQDKKRTADNLRIKETFRKLIKAAKTNPTVETLSDAFSGIDKAAKKHLIHKNKAARLKSSLSKSIEAVVPAKTSSKKKTTTKTTKKTSTKKAASKKK